MVNYFSLNELKKKKFKYLGKNVLISKKCSLINVQNISVGDNSRVDDYCVLQGKIEIGKNVHITPMCLVGGGKLGVVIEDFSTLAYGVKVFSQTDDYTDGFMTNSTVDKKFKKEIYKKIIIKKHSIIGCNSVIFPGSILEEGTSVGAMSLINFKTKKWGVYVGVPAKIIKKRRKVKKSFLSDFSYNEK